MWRGWNLYILYVRYINILCNITRTENWWERVNHFKVPFSYFDNFSWNRGGGRIGGGGDGRGCRVLRYREAITLFNVFYWAHKNSLVRIVYLRMTVEVQIDLIWLNRYARLFTPYAVYLTPWCVLHMLCT